MHLVVDVLRPGDHLIDVGANVGVYSLLASTIPEVQVWAFEPSSASATRAEENIRRNGLEGRCRLFKAAAGRKSEQGQLTVGLDTLNRIMPATGRTGCSPDSDLAVEPVDIVALDDVIPAALQTAVAVIKIDVEGNEVSVLEGAQTLLDRSGAIVIVEPNEPASLSRFFAERGYVQCSYEPSTHQIVLTPQRLPGQLNSIYVRDIDAVRHRLRTSHGHPS